MSETKDSESNSESDRKMETPTAASTASASPTTTTGTKRSASEADSSKPAPSETQQPRKKKINSKLSGFSLGLVADEPEKPKTTGIPPLPAQPTGAYKPLLLSSLPPLPTIDYKDSQPIAPARTSPPPQQDIINTPQTTAPQGIDTLVKEAGMTEQGLQILQGRHRNRDAPIKIVDYNVDEQYSYNQNLRDSGALQTVQPVKGISSGKHQLRTLISSANLQKESLEEAFASGRRNKKESGAKYGF